MKLKEEKSGEYKSYLVYFIIGIMIVISIIIYFTFFRLEIKVKSSIIPRCSDGTIYDSCSTDKPLFCLNGSLASIPIKCGCNEGLILADYKCKDPASLLPDSNFSCNELAPKELFVGFSNTGHSEELIDRYNSLTNTIPLNNTQRCFDHPPLKAGENINVLNLFYCYGYSNAGGEVDSNGIVKKSYKISYEFTMDKTSCINMSTYSLGSTRKCSVNSINCSWNLTN